ncbi:glycosyltransferase [Nitrospira moscoviensis]|uniref:Spore protein YkvP/CgeB glycosyl transferase-like domain-containing protein n=1 Tax=Nitrospira moscoviensis TaxID=42253 RepID=A0A0K2GGE9_NITMO|nr:glycosyltransferase [Nitrospira moscoviensis]ALA59909.1 hypothetical protein NITMOv2_3517 [Nitrospira moscoviensis]
MFILFLGDQHFDYVSDPLYVGLSRLRGNDCVVDYPYKRLYHDPEASNWYMIQRPGIRYGREEVQDLLAHKKVDLVCIASFRPDCLEEVTRLYGRVPFPPVVFIDGADDANIRHDVVSRYRPALYFKRDYIWGMRNWWPDVSRRFWHFRGDRQLFDRTIPLPVSIIPEILPSVSACKDIDVSYTGRVSHPRRLDVTGKLSSLAGVRFEGGVYAEPTDRRSKLIRQGAKRLWVKLTDDGPVDRSVVEKKKAPQQYYQEIARSKIAVHIRGGGLTPSPRYYEIPLLGTLLLSDTPESVVPDNFENGRHAVFFRNDLKDLEPLVRHYLSADNEREEISRAGREHALKHHTCERRAEYFLDVCRRMI